MYLIPLLIGKLGPFGPIVLIKTVLNEDDGIGIGLNELLIERDEPISREQPGSSPGRFGGIEVDTILIIIGNLELI